MNNKIFLASLIISFTVTIGFSQEVQQNSKTYFVNDKGEIYFNKDIPVYLWFSTSPDASAKNYRLTSETHKAYSNPMYLDTDGFNSLRIISALDQNKKPFPNVKFPIFADGSTPNTTVNFSGANTYVKNGKNFYGKGLEVTLKANDDYSGLKTIYYAINGGNYTAYQGPFEIDQELEDSKLTYYAVDNVGNEEKPVEKLFGIDLTPPTISKQIEGKSVKNVLSKNAVIVLNSKDNMTGVYKIYYIVNNQEPKEYTKPIPALNFLGGTQNLRYYSVDNVKNTNINNANKDINSEFSYGFQIDDSGPRVNFEIQGSQYKANMKIFVSPQSEFVLTAKDAISEIKQINYRLNSSPEKEYTAPVNFNNTSGVQVISYNAIDEIDNKSNDNIATVYVDATAPASAIDFVGNQFFNRDTLFINTKTKIKLFSTDNEAGVAKIDYQINGQALTTYSNPFTIDKEGYNNIAFSATDLVDNKETNKLSYVMVDNSAPVIYVNFSIEPIRYQTNNGESYPVYPAYVKMYLSATDKHTGEEELFFSVNNSKLTKYIGTSQIEQLKLLSKEQFYTVKIVAKDKLENQSEKEIKFYISKK